MFYVQLTQRINRGIFYVQLTQSWVITMLITTYRINSKTRKNNEAAAAAASNSHSMKHTAGRRGELVTQA
jgi:hypothetical protein